MHNNSVSTQLLKNSQISGIRTSNTSSSLSGNKHGLFIETNLGVRYADLRLAIKKPFWGHTHPLFIHYENNNLTTSKYTNNFSLLSKKNFLNQNTKSFISFEKAKRSTSLDSKIIKIDEKDILHHEEINIFIENNSSHKLEFYLEDCLNFPILFKLIKDQGHTFYLNISFIKSIITNKTQLQSETQEYYLVQAMFHYLEYLVWSENGKNTIDTKIIQSKLKTSDIIQLDRYLVIQGNYTTKVIKTFLSHGILIDESNLQEQGILLCLPIACTNQELSDTLSVILNVKKEI